jgi:hypothetical protein
VSLLLFALAQSIVAFMASVGLLAAGRALISGSLEAWYVDSLRLLDPSAPLTRGLSRGTAAEGIAMALGALVGGGLVTVAGSGDGALSGYGVAALAGALAAVAYLVAIALLVHESHEHRHADAAGASVGRRAAVVFATARTEFAESVVVRVVVITGVALGMSFTAVELLWQPRLADLLSGSGSHGVAFGGLGAAAMVAVAVGAALSSRLNRRLGVRIGYLLALAFAAVCVALLGAPQSAAGFVLVYLLAYFGMGLAEPMHFELLNDAVGATARATLISAESLATQAGALVANLSVGLLASSRGPALAWALAGTLLTVTALAVAAPLLAAFDRRPPSHARAAASRRARA